MNTLICLSVPLLMGFAVGVPLICLLRRSPEITGEDWGLAPFAGCAAIVVVLHNLIYRDITVSVAAPYLWGCAALAWSLLIWRYGAKAIVRSLPALPMLIVVGVYVICTLGVVSAGAEVYLGRAHSDGYNYTIISQFLADMPFSTTWSEAGNRPWLTKALLLKEDRIGAMLLQAFASVSCLAPTRHLLGAMLLLGAPLMSCAAYLFLRRLNADSRLSLAAMAIAGLIPGYAIIYSSGALAQSLGQSFVLAVVYLLHEAVAGPRRGTWVLTSLVLAATATLYTEYSALLALFVVAAVLCGVLFRTIRWSRGLITLVVLAAGWPAAIPEFLPSLWLVVRRMSHPTAGGNPLGWIPGNAFSGVVWFPDFIVLGKPHLALVWSALGCVLTALALFGWAKLLQSGTPDAGSPEGDLQRRRQHRVLKIACFALLAIPLASIASFGKHPYQVYKLLLGFSPVLAFGFAFYWSGNEQWRQLQIAFTRLVVLLVTGGTALMAMRDGTDAIPSKGEVTARHVAHHVDRIAVQAKLEELRDQDVVLAGGPGVFYNGWLSYAARHNRVWLVNPVEASFALGCTTSPLPRFRPLPFGHQFVDLSNLPDRVLVLSDGKQVDISGNPRQVWRSGQFTLWEVDHPSRNLHPTELAWRSTVVAAQEQTSR